MTTPPTTTTSENLTPQPPRIPLPPNLSTTTPDTSHPYTTSHKNAKQTAMSSLMVPALSAQRVSEWPSTTLIKQGGLTHASPQAPATSQAPVETPGKPTSTAMSPLMMLAPPTKTVEEQPSTAQKKCDTTPFVHPRAHVPPEPPPEPPLPMLQAAMSQPPMPVPSAAMVPKTASRAAGSTQTATTTSETATHAPKSPRQLSTAQQRELRDYAQTCSSEHIVYLTDAPHRPHHPQRQPVPPPMAPGSPQSIPLPPVKHPETRSATAMPPSTCLSTMTESLALPLSRP
jgi:hypothetical protein